MPALQKMSKEKQAVECPALIIAAQMEEKKMSNRKTKKYVIIAVSAILAAAIILTAILVGMYMFTEAQKEIIKYSVILDGNTKQDVTSDPNENVVQYHVSNADQETWIVNDFNKDIQLMKIKRATEASCYISPLNRTNLLDPTKITGPEFGDVNDSVSLMYFPSDTPVSDTSFLGKTARETCKGMSVYWLYPYCLQGTPDKGNNLTETTQPKSKREAMMIDYSPNDAKVSRNKRGDYRCLTGCCRRVCGTCSMRYTSYISGGWKYCSWVIGPCRPSVYVFC